MTTPDVAVWLVAGYALLLLAAAWGFDLMAKRISASASARHTGRFVYHPDHDAWKCPQDEWLWPTSFDPANRVMRYRARPAVCNACPVKADCTASHHGREISRHVDPWPHSEAGRFHRGIACVIAGLAIVMLPAQSLIKHSPADLMVSGATLAIVLTLAAPLFRHLFVTPVDAPAHLPHRSAQEDSVEAALTKYAASYSRKWSAGSVGRERGAR